MCATCPAIVTMDLAGAPVDPAATPAPATTTEAMAQPAIASAAIVCTPGRLRGNHRDRLICSPLVPPSAGHAGRLVLISTDRRAVALHLPNSGTCQSRYESAAGTRGLVCIPPRRALMWVGPRCGKCSTTGYSGRLRSARTGG